MVNTNALASFESLDLGSVQPTSVPMEVVEVEIGAQSLLGQYSKAFVSEAYRVNPLRAEQVGLTSTEVEKYSEYLLLKRIECVDGQCKDFYRLKSLYIPSFIQYTLSMIGEVKLRDIGLTLKPIAAVSDVISFEEAVAISEKIGSFEHDLQIVQDAMPRDPKGDKNVMSTAMIAGYVRALQKVDHVASTYVTAFLGMKLKQENAFAALYRVQYDDAAFIATALTSQKGLY